MFFSHTSAVYSFIKNCFQPYYHFVLFHLVITVVSGLHEPLRSYFFRNIINEAALAVNTHQFADLWYAALLLLAVQVSIIGLFRIYDIVLPLFWAQLSRRVGLVLAEKMLSHAPAFYQKYFSGNMANKMNDVVRGIPNIEMRLIDNFFYYIIFFTSSLYAAWVVNIKFVLLLGIWIGSILLFVALLFRPAEYYSKQVASKRSRVTGHIVDALMNILNVRLFVARHREIEHCKGYMQQVYTASRARDWFLWRANVVYSFSFIIILFVTFYWLITGLEQGTVSIGDFGLILSLNGAIIQKLWKIADDMRKLSEEWGNVSQALSVILLPPSIQDVEGAKPLQVQGEIAFKDVTFGYSPQEPIFTHFNLTIPVGQKVGIVGYSGCGKSTLLNLLLRLVEPQQGTILIDDQPIDQVTQDSLHKSIAITSQEPLLFHRSIAENIQYADENASFEQIEQAATFAQADYFIRDFPEQYNTIVGERGTKLSGGQRQRIAIARALLKKAPILILDEATSQLDSVTEQKLQQQLWKLMHGKTVLVVAHRLSTLVEMDRIIVLERGVIIQDGTHEQLINQEGLYKKLWETQSSTFEA